MDEFVMYKLDLKKFLASITIAEGIGWLSGLLSGDKVTQYHQLLRPHFSPPGYIFDIIWFFMYLLIGISAYKIWSIGIRKSGVRDALNYYYIQLFFSFMWSIILFRFEMRGIAFIWLIVYIMLAVICAYKFYKINKFAGLLMIPYILFLAFGAYLNYFLWLYNQF